MCVRREGALDQRVEVPPEEEVVSLGSYLAGTTGDRRTRSPETEGLGKEVERARRPQRE